MSRSVSTVIGSIVLVLLALFGLLAAVFGPGLYREGKALVAPIAALAGAEESMAALDRELPFVPSKDRLVDEARLLAFLDVWDELRPRYQQWQQLAEDGQRGRSQSWQDAKAMLGATREVQRAQIDILRARGMSRAELLWLEDMVLSAWWRRIEPMVAGQDRVAVAERLRKAGEDDLRFVATLERQHGRSPALHAIEQRLRQRLASLDGAALPAELPELPLANQQLFWRHRQRIAAIGAPSSYPLHGLLRGKSVRLGERRGRRSRPSTSG